MSRTQQQTSIHSSIRPSFFRASLGLIGLALLASACDSAQLSSPESIGAAEQAVTPSSTVIVNQLGYLAEASKVAVGVGSCGAVAFQVKNTGGTTVHSGTTSAATTDIGSGDTVCKADFSAFKTPGSYTVTIGSLGTSDTFTIGTDDPFTSLYENAMAYFTYHRLGSQTVNISLTGSKGGTVSRSWALRPTTNLTGFGGWTTSTFDTDGGHADAGDFGLYADNAVQSLWVLMNLFELKAPTTALSHLPSAETGNTLPDLLDEIDYGAKWMRDLLPDETSKQAAHKCHDDEWGNMSWGGYPSGNDNANRHCAGGSITATYSMARVFAQLSRVVAPYDTTKANTYWTLAQNAWTRAAGATTPVFTPGQYDMSGGGDYDDGSAVDDKYSAAVEMFLTAKSRSESFTAYKTVVTGDAVNYKKVSRKYFDWKYDYTPGNLSLAAYHLKKGSLSADIDVTGLKTNIVTEADDVLTTINGNGFPVPIYGNGDEDGYTWGSNKVVMHSIVLLAYAYEFTGDVKYLKGVHRAMDYIMGVNTLRLSFITGYGNYFEQNTHDRMANGNSPLGWLSGGPVHKNQVILSGDSVTPQTNFPAKNYHVSSTSGWDSAWSSKENTIDWNAPLAWVSWFMRSTTAPTLGRAKLVNKAAGHEMALASDVQNSGNIVAEAVETADDHLWSLVPDGSTGWYWLQNKKSLMYANVTGAFAFDNANIALWNVQNAGDHLKVKLVDQGNGYVKIQFKHSLKYLATQGNSAGTNIHQVSDSTDTKLLWQKVASGSYWKFVQHTSGFEMGVAAETQNSANVNAEAISTGADHYWTIQDAGGGYYYIKNNSSNIWINVTGAYTMNNANVAMWNVQTAGDHLKVKFISDGAPAGFYKIVFKHTEAGTPLYLCTLGTSDGTNVQACDSTAGDRLLWKLQ
jgi:endoglucanase